MYAVRNLDEIKINTMHLLQPAIPLCPNECVISFCNPEKKGTFEILKRKLEKNDNDENATGMYICMICKLKTDLESITEHRSETFHEFKSEKSKA